MPTVPAVSVAGVTVIVGAETVMVIVAGSEVPAPLVAVYWKLSAPW